MVGRAPPPSIGPQFEIAAKGVRSAAHSYTAPVSLRMSFAEKAQLERDAAGMSIAAYIRWRLFHPDKPPPRTRGRHPVKDQRAIAQLLALLGQSRLANNVNQLARSANSGSLPLTPDIERALNEAAADIAEIRKLLLRALNLEVS